MHYYQFNIGDYKSHTDHLDPIEDIAYRRMIDHCYLHESLLPLDIKEISRVIRMRTHCDVIQNILDEFFYKKDDGYFCKRIEKEIKAFKDKSKKAKASAKARWDKPTNSKASKSMRTHSDGNADAKRSVCDGNAKHKPLNINHKPITNNQSNTKKASIDFDAFGMSKDQIDEMILIRKKNKGGPITQRSANALAKQFDLAKSSGLSIDDILTEWDVRGWKSFKFEWMNNDNHKPAHRRQSVAENFSQKDYGKTGDSF